MLRDRAALEAALASVIGAAMHIGFLVGTSEPDDVHWANSLDEAHKRLDAARGALIEAIGAGPLRTTMEMEGSDD